MRALPLREARLLHELGRIMGTKSNHHRTILVAAALSGGFVVAASMPAGVAHGWDNGEPGYGGGGGTVEELSGRMTGGGSIFCDGSRVTHGFELHCSPSDTPNNLEINFDGGDNFHLTSLSTVTCSDDPAIEEAPPVAGFDTLVATGTGTFNQASGYTIRFTLTDAGEPGGGADTAAFLILDEEENVVLDCGPNALHQGGNHQAHELTGRDARALRPTTTRVR
jgi:hypothetical protein